MRNLLPLFLCGSFLLGCGGSSSPDRIDIAGSVTFKGSPVPQGRIDFFPKVQGPAAYAMIENGRYDTHKTGKGVTAGAYRVKIQGFDGVALGVDGGENGTQLFAPHETVAEVTEGKQEFDFSIPETAAAKK